MKKLFESFSEFRNSILEVGDSSAGSYPFKLDYMEKGDMAEYVFKTATSNYLVTFQIQDYSDFETTEEHPINSENLKEVYNISFEIVEDNKSTGYDKVNNKGEIYKVMATIVQIIEDFIKKNPKASFEFEGVKKDNENTKLSKRDNIYISYLKQHITSNMTFKTYDKSKIYDGNGSGSITFIIKK